MDEWCVCVIVDLSKMTDPVLIEATKAQIAQVHSFFHLLFIISFVCFCVCDSRISCGILFVVVVLLLYCCVVLIVVWSDADAVIPYSPCASQYSFPFHSFIHSFHPHFRTISFLSCCFVCSMYFIALVMLME